ncbi:nucleotide-binding domain containing protein [uncultured Oscillibacter sp.]|uniref:nucleotide-binding domain containing protein n=1 Tax=uncultured Oscillibacter sp. TaxID=876091 RepID=UPI002805D294|nr:nucleotide-binding domain containing protein [uncultured Oscillibacter sp.]
MLWIELACRGKDCILDANDPEGSQTTTAYAKKQGLTIWQLRTRIADTLGGLVKRLLDGGLEATILCTGGDTLLAMIREIGVSELTPICEVAVGSVLTSFVYRERRYHIISKSGGFGEPELLCALASQVRAKTWGRTAYAE